jgi:hypothetical protein
LTEWLFLGVHFPLGLGTDIGLVRSTFLLIVIMPFSAPAPFTVTNCPDFDSRTVVIVVSKAVFDMGFDSEESSFCLVFIAGLIKVKSEREQSARRPARSQLSVTPNLQM